MPHLIIIISLSLCATYYIFKKNIFNTQRNKARIKLVTNKLISKKKF